MAEGVFRNLTNHTRPDAHPSITHIDSCGTGAYHAGEPPDPRTLAVLKRHSITSDFYSHRARKFRTSDFKDFDYIFAMDEDNKEFLERARERCVAKGEVKEEEAGKVMLFGAFGGKGEEEVQDPYYGGKDGFEKAYEQVERFSRGFVAMLEGKN